MSGNGATSPHGTGGDRAAPRLVIVDTDPGADDVQAIALLLSAERRRELRVLAVTVTAGNTTLKQATRNARRVLATCGRLDIPIYHGAHCSLVHGNLGEKIRFHGANGLNDVQFEEPLPQVPRPEEHAVSALVRLARQHKGEVTILALAPLTNIAMATRMDPDFISNIKDLIIMGGNFTGLGNTTPSGEFNFFTDPEAASIVLSSAPRPVTLVSWELCLNHKIDMEWRKRVLGAADTPVGRLFNATEAELMERDDFDGWVPCDQLAAALLVRPAIALRTSTHHATVELQGEYTRGQLVVDRRGWRDSGRSSWLNVHIVETADVELYKKMLMDAFGIPDVEF